MQILPKYDTYPQNVAGDTFALKKIILDIYVVWHMK